VTVPNADIWTTAYLAALAGPEETLPFLPQPRAFAAQTVRQTVRLRRGGTAVRLVLSNEFGRTPLVIGEIAVSGSEHSTALPVLWRGGARWEIPAGERAVSDPVPLSVAADGELVVTCHVCASGEPSTFMHSAQRTGEAAPGSQVGRPRLTGSEGFTSLYWIERVLTDAPAQRPVIVALGDSIARGVGTTADHDERYPDHLQRRLRGAAAADGTGTDGAVVLNAGLGGNRLLRHRAGPSVIDRFPRDVLGVPEATHVIITAGANDIALPVMLGEEPSTTGDIVDGLFTLARRAARHGIQPLLTTLTPFGGSRIPSIATASNEGIRQAVNHAITSQRDWPVADFAAAVADPADPSRLAAGFDSGDGVHPGDAGARALAGIIDLAVFSQAYRQPA
jgi:lysophospholipase L1-like esterase